MPDLLTMKSKVEIGCEMCDTCCKYRGDIRLTIKNIYNLSRYLNISTNEFIEKYTHQIGNEKLERALNAVGDYRECILYDKQKKKCSVHPVKPLQCVMFPLFPEDIKNDYFYLMDQCKCQNKQKVTVNEWLNGNNKIYNRNKKINYLWVKVLEEIQYKWKDLTEENKNKINNLLYTDYNFEKRNIDSDIKNNIKKIYKIIDE